MATVGTQDPKKSGKQPPFPPQEQQSPGSEKEMSPRPDYGVDSYEGHGRLKGRVALITGGDSGIGRAVAVAFAREGADVAIAYLSEQEDAEETQRWIEDAGQRALLLPGDIADERHCQKLIDETIRKFGRLDILVNNAAYQGKAVESFEQIDAERLDRTFRVNILARSTSPGTRRR